METDMDLHPVVHHLLEHRQMEHHQMKAVKTLKVDKVTHDFILFSTQLFLYFSVECNGRITIGCWWIKSSFVLTLHYWVFLTFYEECSLSSYTKGFTCGFSNNNSSMNIQKNRIVAFKHRSCRKRSHWYAEMELFSVNWKSRALSGVCWVQSDIFRFLLIPYGFESKQTLT